MPSLSNERDALAIVRAMGRPGAADRLEDPRLVAFDVVHAMPVEDVREVALFLAYLLSSHLDDATLKVLERGLDRVIADEQRRADGE